MGTPNPPTLTAVLERYIYIYKFSMFICVCFTYNALQGGPT